MSGVTNISGHALGGGPEEGSATVDGPLPAALLTDDLDDEAETTLKKTPRVEPAPEPKLVPSPGPIEGDGSDTLLDVPPEVLEARVAAQNTKAQKKGSKPESKEAATDPDKAEPSLFAGLLAEADAADKKPEENTAKRLSMTVSKGTDTQPPSKVPPLAALLGSESPIPRNKDRKAQQTFNMEGRGKKRSSSPPPARRSSAPPPRRPSKAPNKANTDNVPDRRLGPYQVLSELGSGGMAVVHKAVQPTLDRLVAIKELRTEYAHDKQVAARFEREATSLATLQHGNIVHIYDFVRDMDTSYIVMEYVEGVDLFEVIARTEVLPSDVAAVIALQIAEGLEYAHYRGIIHRDVKPSNILISKIGEVKIMDFGIARDPGRADITQIGMALGTPAYMSPEQIRADRIDFRADHFSFGILLYEMLTGKLPWPDEGGQAIARRILADDPTPPRTHNPDVPAPLEAIIARCLEKDPDKRYATTYDLRRELEAYIARELTIDSRQRLVVFLRNRRMITEGEASSFVDATIRDDPELLRKDMGWPTPPPEHLLRRVFIACAIALLGVFAAAVVGAMVPWGERLANQAPKMVPAKTRTEKTRAKASARAQRSAAKSSKSTRAKSRAKASRRAKRRKRR